MKISPKAKPYEVLAIAIRSEVDAAELYAALLGRVQNIVLKQKLDFLVFEENQHRKILERLYGQRFARRELVLPAESFLSKTTLPELDRLSVPQLFEAALKAEKLSEDYYKDAGATAEDADSRRMLAYLGRVERSHYFMLKSEMDLMARFPDYYHVEEWNVGQEMIHVGP